MQQIKLCKDKFLIMMTLIVVMVWSGFRAFNLDFVPSHDSAADMLLSNIIRDEGVILPFLRVGKSRIYATMANRCFGVNQPKAILGLS